MIEIRSNSTPDAQASAQLAQCWKAVLARSEVGFPELPNRLEDWAAVDSRARSLSGVKHVWVLGVGGSSLGAQVINQALKSKSGARFYFLESPDPSTWNKVKAQWKATASESHVIVASKTGATLETLAWVERLSAEAGALKSAQCTVIASPVEGPLQAWAKRENIHTLWIPNNVGGRFSVLSAVGMFPAALMGHDLAEFRQGAQWALTKSDLVTKMSAQVLRSWQREEWITQLWSFSESLRIFGEWWQQLWGESLAKKVDWQGKAAPRASTPMACSGPRDQHSLVQQLIEGARDKMVFVTRVKSLEVATDSFNGALFPEMIFNKREFSLGKILHAEVEAFEQSLLETGIDSCAIDLRDLSERSLGSLFMLWQMVVAQIGEAMQINAFDQPGVEIGKKYAGKILSQ